MQGVIRRVVSDEMMMQRDDDDDDRMEVENAEQERAGGQQQQQQQQPLLGGTPEAAAGDGNGGSGVPGEERRVGISPSSSVDEEDGGRGGDGAAEEEVPVTSIRQPSSGLSFNTNSSLSEASESAAAVALAAAEAGSDSASRSGPEQSSSAEGGGGVDGPGGSGSAGVGADADGPAAAANVASPAQPEGRIPRTQSNTTASETWGFFEDHDHLGDTPGNSSSDLRGSSPAQAQRRGGRGPGGGPFPGGGGGGGGGRKDGADGGLLHFSDVLAKPLQDIPILSPQRAETTAMAVTAPTYVLEESMSSQKLWKQTAGNRPPQPVEERAFFEKIWAQNFARSQADYELPVEVLTATSPIALSPFAEGNLDQHAGAAGAHHIHAGGDYSAAYTAHARHRQGPHYPTLGKNKGITDSSELKPSTHDPAAAKAAEASMIHRVFGTAGAAQYYTHGHSVGPLHPHHTVVNRQAAGQDGHLTVVCRGDNVFGTTVSKSFETTRYGGGGGGSKQGRGGTDNTTRTESVSVSVSIASYRVVESKEDGKYAQFLVIYCEGSFRDTVGVWKRYSDFAELSRKVMHGHNESCSTVLAGMHPMAVEPEPETELLPNAITSWRLLKKRQRWFRCLDAGYLSLKVFLLERFLHDILFESSNPDILRDFVNIDKAREC